MPSQYNADGTIPQATRGWVRVPIVDSTNATPIVVHAVAHGFTEGDTVSVEGHDVNTAANGLHTIHVVDADHFSLAGTTGNGVGAATGYVIDYSVNPVITIPADTDPVNAASVDPAFEGLFNPVPFLYRRAGKYALFDLYTESNFAGFHDPFSSARTILNQTLSHVAWNTIFANVMSFPAPGPALLAGDRLSIDWTFTPRIFGSGDGHGDTGTKQDMGWTLGLSLAGGGVTAFEAASQSQWIVGQDIVGHAAAFNLHHEYVAPVAADFFDLAILCLPRIDPVGTLSFEFGGSWQMSIRHYRLNT